MPAGKISMLNIFKVNNKSTWATLIYVVQVHLLLFWTYIMH